MSIKVFERLRRMMIETTREERLEIDEEIERRTKKYCDEGVDELSDIEFVEIVNKVKKRKKEKVGEEAKEKEKEDEDREAEEEAEEKEEVEVYA